MQAFDDTSVRFILASGVALLVVTFIALASRRLWARRVQRRAVRVVGVGQAGAITLANLRADRRRLVERVVIDTDGSTLRRARADRRIHLSGSRQITNIGGSFAAGAAAAQEASELIDRYLAGSELVVVTGGLGGDAASGAIQVVADIARRNGALTVAVVSEPFAFEGRRRSVLAETGLAELNGHVDAVAALPNERVRETLSDDTSIDAVLRAIDQHLRSTIDAVVDMVDQGGRVGLDFASARSLVREAGGGLIGVGRAVGEQRAAEAARQALAVALADARVSGAGTIVMNVAASRTLRLAELDVAVQEVRARAGFDSDVVLGLTLDRRLGDSLQVTLIVSGQPGRAAAQAEGWLPVWRRDRNAPQPADAPAGRAARPSSRRARRTVAPVPDVAGEVSG